MSYLKPILSFLIQYLLILAQTAWAQEQEILPLSESFSPLAELSAYNPLQQHSGTNLNEHTNWQGTFSDGQVSLSLQGDGQHYTGSLTINKQYYPATAQPEGHYLLGTFNSQAHYFQFTLMPQSGAFLLDSEGNQFLLRRTNTYQSSRQAAKNKYANLPPQQQLIQHHRLNQRIRKDFQQFLQQLWYWMGGDAQKSAGKRGNAPQLQGMALLRQQLIPQVQALHLEFQELTRLSQQLEQSGAFGKNATAVFHRFTLLGERGTVLLGKWQQLLEYLAQVDWRKDNQNLYKKLKKVLPVATQNLIILAKNFVVLARISSHIPPKLKGGSPMQSLSAMPVPEIPPSVMNVMPGGGNPTQLKWEIMRNMSEMMRDAMRMMGADF